MESIMISIQPQWVEKETDIQYLENEIWADIKGYKGLYAISNYGRILSRPRKRTKGGLLTPQISKYGYYMQMLYKNGEQKLHRVNRLVAKTFVSNPNNLSQVNHIDGNKLNNKAKNLEWVTQSENQLHAYRIGLQKVSNKQKKIASDFAKTKRIPIYQYDLQYNFLKEFESIQQASDELKIPISCISRVCNGIRKQTHNFIFSKGDKI